MKNNFKYFLGILIAFALLVPMLQSKFTLFEEEKLVGVATVTEKPQFKKEDYWNLTWQENYNAYLNDNFGFRTQFIKGYNEVLYSLFNTTKAPGVVIGKEGELFIESYIDEYIGRNFIGNSKIKENVSKIKQLQDSLKARGKDLIVVFAPGKASYYPELIPNNYLSKKKDSTNYKSYASEFAQKQVNFLDLNKWFYQNKPNFKHKVYPKYGTHWNHYGMAVGLDTIVKYIEKKRNIPMADWDFNVVSYNTNLKGNDFDVGILMNLTTPIEPDPNPYPVYKYKDEDAYKPNVLVVGDSYWWCLVGKDMPKHFFTEDEYWFYNKTQLIKNEKRAEVKSLNLSASLAQRDVILLIATEATFYMFPYGFVDNAHKLYCQDNSKRLNELIANINYDKTWLQSVNKKALEHNISLNAQLKIEAEYLLSEELFNSKESVEDIIIRIKSDEAWMKLIKKKAEEKNSSVEQQIKEDAQWMFNNS